MFIFFVQIKNEQQKEYSIGWHSHIGSTKTKDKFANPGLTYNIRHCTLDGENQPSEHSEQ